MTLLNSTTSTPFFLPLKVYLASFSISHNPQLNLTSPSSMADPISPSKPQPTVKTKSFSHILCKSLVFLIFLVAIPLFPSQAPNFINQNFFTKFWDLIHLLFIGLAVSYGLFSRRNVDVDYDVQSSNVVVDDPQSSFVSRIFHVSPIFEDGYENPSGSDEKNLYSSWVSSQYYSDDGKVRDFSNEQNGTPSVGSENGFERSAENDDSNGLQSWNSQYFQGESMVVVSQPNYAFDESGNPVEVVGYKPLGLPVRSLKSGAGSSIGEFQFSNGSESGSSLNGGSSSSSRRSSYEPSFGDTGSVNLEGEFDETVDLHSQVRWRSRSDRMEIREKVDLDSVATRPSHFRPFSVDETQFESLKSRSLGSTASLSSPVSSVPDSPSGRSSSNSVASELPLSETEELEKMTGYRASYPPVSQSSLLTTMNGETRLNAFHLRRYSSGSLFQKDPRKGLKRELREYARSRREESAARKEREQVSSKQDAKPATPVKASAKGKSVRTIRASRYAAATKAEERSENYIDDELAKICGKLNAGNTGEGEMKRGHDNMSIRTSKMNLDVESPMPKPTFAKQKRGKQESFDSVIMNRKEESESKKEEGFDSVIMNTKVEAESKARNFQVRSDDAATEAISEAESDSNEVDRKAGEFIAKFKEQIRLQKVASIERSSRKDNRVNNFR